MLALMLFFTSLGDPEVVFLIAFSASIFFIVFHKDSTLRTFSFGVISALIISYSLKYLVGEVRPSYSPVLNASSPSFPSAHALISTVVYGFIGTVLIRQFKALRTAVAGFIFLVLPIFIGISRVYLHVHWWIDVIAGWLIGGLILYLLIKHINFTRNRLNNIDIKYIRKEKAVFYVIIFVETVGIFLYWFILMSRVINAV